MHLLFAMHCLSLPNRLITDYVPLCSMLSGYTQFTQSVGLRSKYIYVALSRVLCVWLVLGLTLPRPHSCDVEVPSKGSEGSVVEAGF